MLASLRPALSLLLFLSLLTGIAYPLLVTEIATVIFPSKAQGSLVIRDGRPVGSVLIGQAFTGEAYFHPRLSMAGNGYDATSSSGSNLGPTSAKLAERLMKDANARREAGIAGLLPADAVTSSGSGLDPHISPAYAMAQVQRVAKARGADEALVRTLVNAHIEVRPFGIFGDPRVNVLMLNLALEAASPGS